MYALKVVITTLNVIFMFLILSQCRRVKSKEAIIGFSEIIALMAANLFCIWR